jgi:hypothetical protein
MRMRVTEQVVVEKPVAALTRCAHGKHAGDSRTTLNTTVLSEPRKTMFVELK